MASTKIKKEVEQEKKDPGIKTPPEMIDSLKQSVKSTLKGVPLKTIVAANLVTVLTIVLVILVWKLRTLVILFFLSLFITLVLEPFVSRLVKKGLKRTIAVTIVFSALAIVVASVAFALLTPAYESVDHLITHLPSIVAGAEKGRGPVGAIVKKLHLENYVRQNDKKLKSFVTNLGKPALLLGKTILSGLVGLATLVVMTFFLMLEMPIFLTSLFKAVNPKREDYLKELLNKVLRTVSGYMLGRLLIAIIAFSVVLISLLILGVPYSLALALWVGVVDFLPIIGGLLAAIPTIGLSFLHSIAAGVIFTLIFLAYLQLENHVLNTIVLAKTVKLNPFWVLLSVLLGADIGSIVAHEAGAVIFAIIAIPVAGIIQILVGEFFERRSHGADADQERHSDVSESNF
jgi:predicted PurR-regulated permease PerM